MQLLRITQEKLLLAAGCALIFVLIATHTTNYAVGDTKLTLLTSQSLLENGTPILNSYQDEIDLFDVTLDKTWMVYHDKATGNWFDVYPLGTAVWCMPIVFAANRLGLDMVLPEHDFALQRAITAMLAIAVFLLLFRIARFFLPEVQSIGISLIIFLGSTLISGLGTALWSHDFLTLFICFSLIEILKAEKGEAYGKFNPWWLGFLLFAAYFTRPTAATFIIPVMVWAVIRQRKHSWKIAAVSGVLFGAFLLYSRFTYGRFFPPYYEPTHWPVSPSFFPPIWAILFSPARGLFLFSPLLLFAFSGWAFKAVRRNAVFLLLMSWFVFQLIILTRHENWWGGWSYGPRFFTEMIPAFLVLILINAECFQNVRFEWIKKVSGVVFVLFAGTGIFAHSYKGLYFPPVVYWDSHPMLDDHADFAAWNWRYPQMFATQFSNETRSKEFVTWQFMQHTLTQIPDAKGFLLGEPTLQWYSIFRAWNKRGVFPGVRFYHSLKAYTAHPVDTLYFTADLLDTVTRFGGFRIEPMVQPVTLGKFCADHSKNVIFLSARDEASSYLSEETRQYFRSIGSQIDSLKYRSGYIAVIDHGKLRHESMSVTKPLEYHHVFPPLDSVSVLSAGMDAGNISEIVWRDVEFSRHQRGINALVVNDARKVVTTAYFDTHREDVARPTLYRAIRNK